MKSRVFQASETVACRKSLVSREPVVTWYRPKLVMLLISAFLLTGGVPLQAGEKQSLFNGHSLEGWSGDENVWSVQDGQIVGTTIDNTIEANTFLVWQGDEIGDFRLTFQARVEGDNNSGVQYRSKVVEPKTWKVSGYQADMHPKPEYTAMLYSEGTGRGIVAERGQKVVVDAKTGEPEVVGQTSPVTPVDISQWHEYTIEAKGNHLIHLLDGEVTVDVLDNHREQLDTGVIALQVHAGRPMTVWFKDIVLELLSEESADEAEQEISREPAEKSASALPEITSIAEGFQIEKIFQVPESMGSWVSLAVDDRGRLIASDQADAGLFLIIPGEWGVPESTQVSKLPVETSGAQGMLWAFDSLYAMVNNKHEPGLHRLTDNNGDGLLDTDEYLMRVVGRGEHGPHAIVQSPDGKSLFVAGGNHTDLPQAISGSRSPQNWGEDLLLPRRWDARGHAKGRLAPGGWICKVNPTGQDWEVFSTGFRNQYDFAFNADGELFVYDADMEWDMGLPWYRPTRLVHATSGSEFGWRSGTGKWPDYYEDSLPPALELGPGSPTGVAFGYGAKFPAKYQKALYLLDWTFGTIYAVHLAPEGASYRGQKEEFITGVPLPVTDAVVGADGALYFIVGGRGTQSALYRVIYSGDESTVIADYQDPIDGASRERRHQLEAMHGIGDGDLDEIFANLGHPDRFVRYAARIALESQPVEDWRERALTEADPRAAISALIALARQGESTDRDSVINALDRIDFSLLDEQGQLSLLRAYGLVFIRLGEPDEEIRQRLVAKLSPFYPSATRSYPINAELSQLLVYLRDPAVVKKTLALMDRLGPESVPDWVDLTSRSDLYGGTIQSMMSNMPPTQAIYFAFVLRNVKSGWTLEERRKYFNFFLDAANHPGGMSYSGFLSQIRDDAIASCSQVERTLLEQIVSQSLTAEPVQATPPKGPGRNWTKAEALAALRDGLDDRDLGQGRNLFHAVSCANCHRFNGEGGAIGPDLSTVSRRLSLADLLDSILEPNKVISDQYESHLVQTIDGIAVTGRVIEFGDEIHVFTEDPDAPPRVFDRSEIGEISVSKVSQMPSKLVDTLNQEELRDLVAYIMSKGN